MINYITAPFRWFFKLEAASGLLLLIGAVIGVFFFDNLVMGAAVGVLFGLVIKNIKEHYEKKNKDSTP